MPQWSTAEVTDRLVRDLLLSEMAQLRPGGWPLPAGSQAAASDWHWVHDLGADSLELLQLTTALADTLGLRDLAQAQALFEAPRWGDWLDMARTHWHQPPDRLRFRTSGSTGTPRSCWHALPHLWEEMCAMAAVIGPTRRVVSAVRCHHIYGFLFTVLLPHALAATWPESLPPDRPLPLIDLAGVPPIGLGTLVAPGDVVIGFPDWWRAALRATPSWPERVVGISSTAPCPPDLSDSCLQAGLQRLLHVYGSSETAGIGWREWPDPHYTLFPHWQRVPDDSQVLQRPGLTGADAMVRITLQDHVQWQGDQARHFTPGARLDGAVQVGGVNVHLGLVQSRMADLPGVREITLRVTTVQGQPRLKAFVVPMPDAPTDLRDHLLAWARQHLAPPARPVHITLGEALPRNGMGKLCDWPLG